MESYIMANSETLQPVAVKHKSIGLPPPTYKSIVEPGFRVPETTRILDKVGFTIDEIDFLFDLYGKQTVLNGISAYVASPTNSHRDDNLTNPWENQRGLVATLESIRTRGLEATQNDVLGSANIVDVMSAKYKNREPALRARTEEDNFRLALLRHFVGIFLKSNYEPDQTKH